MLKRWMLYLVVWVGCLIFYYAYGQWLGWVLLAAVSVLPVCSLVLSLPVMLTARLQLRMPAAVSAGDLTALELTLRSVLPHPDWKVRVLAHHPLSGKTWLLQPGFDCPTEHCGVLECSFSRGRIYDYLGLFCLRLKTPESRTLVVLPKPRKPAVVPDAQRQLAAAWRPKPGGGFSENHELRLYRPGDSLRQIHWKLSGKTGKLILRQSMEPRGSGMLIWLYLRGDEETLDHKLGNLWWLSRYLQENQLCHDVLAYTDSGIFRRHVDSAEAVQRVLEELLACPAMTATEAPVHTDPAPLQYYIGGDEDETS